MIKHKYGTLSHKQMNKYIKKLHDKIFWLLLYKDPKVNLKEEERVNEEEFKSYFMSIMVEINGLNSLFGYPPEIVQLLSVLEYAQIMTQSDAFDFQKYRKLILDSESLVTQIGGVIYDE